MIQSEEQKEKMKKNEYTETIIKHTKLCIESYKEKRVGKVLNFSEEIIAKNFSNLTKSINLHIRETH